MQTTTKRAPRPKEQTHEQAQNRRRKTEREEGRRQEKCFVALQQTETMQVMRRQNETEAERDRKKNS